MTEQKPPNDPRTAAPEDGQRVVRATEAAIVVATPSARRTGSFLLFYPAARLATALSLAALLTAATACGADDDDGADSGGPPAGDAAGAPGPDLGTGRGDIRATVTHTGVFDGTLRIGAFSTNPPESPPLAQRRVTAPVFPVTVELLGLDPGTYYVVGALDTAPPSPTIPGGEDTTGASEAVTLLGDDRAEVTLAIP